MYIWSAELLGFFDEVLSHRFDGIFRSIVNYFLQTFLNYHFKLFLQERSDLNILLDLSYLSLRLLDRFGLNLHIQFTIFAFGFLQFLLTLFFNGCSFDWCLLLLLLFCIFSGLFGTHSYNYSNELTGIISSLSDGRQCSFFQAEEKYQSRFRRWCHDGRTHTPLQR